MLSRSISGGMHEDLDITNYGSKHVRFNLEIPIRSDFADIFEVKSRKIVRRGRIITQWLDDNRNSAHSITAAIFSAPSRLPRTSRHRAASTPMVA